MSVRCLRQKKKTKKNLTWAIHDSPRNWLREMKKEAISGADTIIVYPLINGRVLFCQCGGQITAHLVVDEIHRPLTFCMRSRTVSYWLALVLSPCPDSTTNYKTSQQLLDEQLWNVLHWIMLNNNLGYSDFLPLWQNLNLINDQITYQITTYFWHFNTFSITNISMGDFFDQTNFSKYSD